MENKHKSKVLQGATLDRVSFNPKNRRHRESLKHFIETGNWGEVRFAAELPHVEVPMTCLVKLARYSLGLDK
jgi:hypothetical protein